MQREPHLAYILSLLIFAGKRDKNSLPGQPLNQYLLINTGFNSSVRWQLYLYHFLYQDLGVLLSLCPLTSTSPYQGLRRKIIWSSPQCLPNRALGPPGVRQRQDDSRDLPECWWEKSWACSIRSTSHMPSWHCRSNGYPGRLHLIL